MKFVSVFALSVVLLAGCASAPEVDPLVAPIVDRTLTNPDNGATVVLGSDGTVKGLVDEGGAIVGVYEIRNGLYCRTLSQPPGFEGTECQTMALTEDTVTFESPTGRTSTWMF